MKTQEYTFAAQNEVTLLVGECPSCGTLALLMATPEPFSR